MRYVCQEAIFVRVTIDTTFDISTYACNQLMAVPGSKLAKTNGKNGLRLVSSTSHKRALIDVRYLGKGTQFCRLLFVYQAAGGGIMRRINDITKCSTNAHIN